MHNYTFIYIVTTHCFIISSILNALITYLGFCQAYFFQLALFLMNYKEKKKYWLIIFIDVEANSGKNVNHKIQTLKVI